MWSLRGEDGRPKGQKIQGKTARSPGVVCWEVKPCLLNDSFQVATRSRPDISGARVETLETLTDVPSRTPKRPSFPKSAKLEPGLETG